MKSWWGWGGVIAFIPSRIISSLPLPARRDKKRRELFSYPPILYNWSLKTVKSGSEAGDENHPPPHNPLPRFHSNHHSILGWMFLLRMVFREAKMGAGGKSQKWFDFLFIYLFLIIPDRVTELIVLHPPGLFLKRKVAG